MRVLWTSTPTTHYLLLPPEGLRLGEPHRRNHRLQLHLYPVPAPETAPAPVPAQAPPQATTTGTDSYAMQPGVTRADTRSQVRSSAATDYRANRNNRADLAGILRKDTLQQVHKLGSPKLGHHANLDVAHQLDDTFSTENATATNNTQGSFSAGEKKK